MPAGDQVGQQQQGRRGVSYRLSRALVPVEIVVVMLFGGYVALTMQLWAPADESAHADFVQTVAEQHRLPVLNDATHPEVLSIGDGVYPAAVASEGRGLYGTSYEAFQPPLYYVVAAPVFAIPLDHLGKVRALRMFGVMLLGFAMVVVVRIVRELFPRNWHAPAALALLVFAQPGIVMHSAAVGNDALIMPLAAVLTALLVRAWVRDSTRDLAWASLVFGLILLTKLTAAFLVVPVAMVALRWLWRRRNPRAFGILAALALVPLVVVAPWLAWNRATYGSITATEIGQDQMRPIVLAYGFATADVVHAAPSEIDMVDSEEVRKRFEPPWPRLARLALLGLLLVAPPVFLVVRGGRWLRGLLLAVPLVSGLAVLGGLSLLQRWPVTAPRYIIGASAAGWAVLVAVGWYAALRSRRALVRLVLITAVPVLFLYATVIGFVPVPRPAIPVAPSPTSTSSTTR